MVTLRLKFVISGFHQSCLSITNGGFQVFLKLVRSLIISFERPLPTASLPSHPSSFQLQCVCDCAVGICTDRDNYCSEPCADQYTTNVFAGCQPGWDCPWHADSVTGYCVSEMVTSRTTKIFRTAKQCCDEEFKSSGTCVTESKDNAPPFPYPVYDWLNAMN